jgi:hypothetical protein
MGFAPALRRFTLTTHVTSSVGWIGAVLVFLALAAIGLSSHDEGTVRGAYLVMAPAAWLVLVPLAHASLLSGIALSLGTPWGLFRHYWVVAKLLITAFSTVVLMIYLGTFRQMAGVAADPVAELALVRNPSPIVHAILALILLLIATVLAIYKPFGVTPYGRRKVAERRQTAVTFAPAKTGFSPRSTGTLLWRYAAAALAIIALLFLLLHRAGVGMHH